VGEGSSKVDGGMRGRGPCGWGVFKALCWVGVGHVGNVVWIKVFYAMELGRGHSAVM